MFNWDEAAVETARAGWAEGLSASEIASRLGGKVTRNAVIGKMHRLRLTQAVRKPTKLAKLPRRPKPRKPLVFRPMSFRGPPKEPAPMPIPAAADVARVSLLDLEPHHCRWPVGEPVQGFCGCDKVPGLSYCQTHAARAFATPSTNRQTPQPTPNVGMTAIVAVEEFLAEAVS